MTNSDNSLPFPRNRDGGTADQYSAMVGEHNRDLNENTEADHQISKIIMHQAYDK